MKTQIHTIVIATLFALFSSPLLTSPAGAAPAGGGEANFEITAGAYASGANGYIADGGAFGVRGGYRFTDRWALQGSVSRVDRFDVVVPFVDVDGNATFFDISAIFFVNPRRRAEFFLYGGVGMAHFDVDVGRIRLDFDGRRIGVPPFRFRVDDDFTGHFGLGLYIRLSDRMYLRPDVRSRWLGVENGVVDGEASLGLGWKF